MKWDYTKFSKKKLTPKTIIQATRVDQIEDIMTIIIILCWQIIIIPK